MIYFFIFLIIIVPYFARSERQRSSSLVFSFSLMFFLAAFQYDLTCDWSGYVEIWNAINGNDLLYKEDLEFFYSLFLKVCRPFGFYFFLAITAVFYCYVLYRLVRKRVDSKYYWVFLMTFMLEVNCFFMLVDTNRQTLALMFVMLAFETIIMGLEAYSTKKVIFKSYILAIALLFIGVNIHRATFVALPLLLIPPIFRLKIWNKPYIALIVFFCIYFASKLFPVEQFSQMLQLFFADRSNLMTSYASGIIERDFARGITSEVRNLTFLLSIGLLFNKMNLFEKCTSACFLLFASMELYIPGNAFRGMMYYYIYIPFLASVLYKNIRISPLRITFLIVILLYYMRKFIPGIQNEYYYKWLDLDFVFFHPWM